MTDKCQIDRKHQLLVSYYMGNDLKLTDFIFLISLSKVFSDIPGDVVAVKFTPKSASSSYHH